MFEVRYISTNMAHLPTPTGHSGRVYHDPEVLERARECQLGASKICVHFASPYTSDPIVFNASSAHSINADR